MSLSQPRASILVPDGAPVEAALARITHLGIGAHQDDLEIMAFHGIRECYGRSDKHFGGITCTDGGGSARVGAYAGYSDEAMKVVRAREQNKAAHLGDYGVMIQLAHPSASVKAPASTELRDDLLTLLAHMRPQVVYTHNPADKHDTHIGVFVSVLDALRALPAERRPDRVLGCEVWRGLDWMLDADKVVLDVGGREHLFHALVGLFDSQIAGGKRYDLATLGRARANATFHESHHADAAELLWFAMDLTPLVRDPTLDLIEFVDRHLNAFVHDVRARLARRLGR
jgi:LmbE family N-acetylglucosaminyl deacetylase